MEQNSFEQLTQIVQNPCALYAVENIGILSNIQTMLSRNHDWIEITCHIGRDPVTEELSYEMFDLEGNLMRTELLEHLASDRIPSGYIPFSYLEDEDVEPQGFVPDVRTARGNLAMLMISKHLDGFGFCAVNMTTGKHHALSFAPHTPILVNL